MGTKHFLSALLLLLLFGLFPSESQSLTVNYYDESDYIRSPLFLEQDLIYGRTVSFSQGLELICIQDKVKAEIERFGTMYTPVDLNDIPPGDYKISLTKTGYYPHQIRITISSDGRSSVLVDLRPYTTRLLLKDLPQKALVYINNKKVDGNSADVPIGEASLRIKAFGFEDFFQVLNLGEEEQYEYAPLLIKKKFGLTGIDGNRESIWLDDSPSQKVLKFDLRAEAPGRGEYRIVRLDDNSAIARGALSIDSAITEIRIDPSLWSPGSAGRYKIVVEAENGEIADSAEREFAIREGRKSQWRNAFASGGGFLYSPGAETLPAGLTQIQSGFNPTFTTEGLTGFHVPAFLTLRTALNDRWEIAFGTALYISPRSDESSLDLFASGKCMIAGSKGNGGFSLAAQLSANYNGLAGSFGEVAPFDPFGGVSGLSLALPAQYRLGPVIFVLSPEFRISPSYPMTLPGGFTDGDIYLWNYFKGALVFETGIFTAALSAALQTPPYLQGGDRWPLYGGAEVSLTPGEAGFSLSLFGGVRLCKGDLPLVTTGFSAGFIF